MAWFQHPHMLMTSKCLSESIPMPWALEMCIPPSPGHCNLDVSIGISLGLEWKLTFSSPVATAEFYCSWGSQGKNTEVVCHSLLQWTTFCQTSPPWPIHLGWPHMAWLSFIELDKAVVRVIRLACCLWLWFQSVCPLMPSLSAYHLTWVSLTLDVGYLFMAAPAKCSRRSLPRTWGSSSWPCFCAAVAASTLLRCRIICRVHHKKRWARGSTSWNQDCREKYQ